MPKNPDVLVMLPPLRTFAPVRVQVPAPSFLRTMFVTPLLMSVEVMTPLTVLLPVFELSKLIAVFLFVAVFAVIAPDKVSVAAEVESFLKV